MAQNNNIEQRTLETANFRIREASEEGVESRTIEGYAIRFNEKSVVLCDWWDGMFREVIAPEAVTREFLDKQDIKLTMYHNREKILGRSCKGEGTLSYEVNEEGVLMSCELPRTALGDECLELIKRGDLQGMSFAFRDGANAGSVEWSEDEDGVPVRTVREMLGIYDMTIAADPAYPTTNVEAREAEEVLGVPEKIRKQREEEEENKKADMAAQERAQRIRTLELLRLGY